MKLYKTLVAVLILVCVANAKAQTADDIIAKHVQAMGGKEAWGKINSIQEQGILNVNGTEISFTIIALHNKGSRQNISVAGLQGYTIYTPSSGWNFFPWQGHMKAEALTAEDVNENQDNLDVQGPLVDYKEKGHSAEYLGTDDFEGTDCYKIKLTEKSGKVITFYIDPSNYFIIHTVTLTKANGQEVETKTDYSNYQKLPEGVWVAMNISNGGNPLKIKKVEVNTSIDENTFKPTN
ncbi:MAG: hypothetical protein ACTHOF_07490 [Flavisolibacter sp.]|jgi:hypothetical protein